MKKIIFLILIIIILAGIFSWWEIYIPKNPFSRLAVIFNIEKGWGAKEIAFNLEKAGLIRCGFFFQFYAYIQSVSAILQAGEYKLSPAMNIPEIVAKLASGDRIKKTITIIEGWTVKDIQELLGDRPGTVSPEAEGYLFPDTYEVLPEDNIEAIVETMKANFERKLSPEMREEIISQNKTISEIVIMASMLEKEVKTPEDKKIVSGILWKRLKVGMPLQVDATISYITGKKTTKISIEETKIDSPYNTYRYLGLPPAPICNPGLESIKAAIEPEESEYWYYLSTPDATTIFSKTLQEHNLAKAKYLK